MWSWPVGFWVFYTRVCVPLSFATDVSDASRVLVLRYLVPHTLYTERPEPSARLLSFLKLLKIKIISPETSFPLDGTEVPANRWQHPLFLPMEPAPIL